MMFETPQMESFDIDTEDDWTICEIIAKPLTGHQELILYECINNESADDRDDR